MQKYMASSANFELSIWCLVIYGLVWRTFAC